MMLAEMTIFSPGTSAFGTLLFIIPISLNLNQFQELENANYHIQIFIQINPFNEPSTSVWVSNIDGIERDAGDTESIRGPFHKAEMKW